MVPRTARSELRNRLENKITMWPNMLLSLKPCEALQCALTLRAKTLHVYSDSEVVVRQMRAEYSCRSPRLYSLNWICRKLARSFHFSISHIPRESNTEANSLASYAIRQQFL